MMTEASPPPHSVALKAVELTLQIPQPLLDTLARMAQYRHCSVETLVVRLIAENAVVQKYFTRAAMDLWTMDEEAR